MNHQKRLLLHICLVLLCTAFLSLTVQAKDYTPEKVQRLRATAQESSVLLKWTPVSKATGYIIYQVDKEKGKTKEIGRIVRNSYTVRNLKNNTKYTFKVRAIRRVGSSAYLGDFSKAVSCTPKVDRPGQPKVSLTACYDKTATLKWNAVDKATGYEIYELNTSTGKYVSIGTVKKTKVTISSLKNNVEHKFKVRSFRKVNGILRYGYFSFAVTAKPLSLKMEIRTVHTIYYTATVNNTVSAPVLKAGNPTGSYVTVYGGTSVTIVERGLSQSTVKLADNTRVRIDTSNLSIHDSVYDSSVDYSKSAKEGFVNAMGYDSSTNYLIWVNLYHQRLHIFQGSQGNWKLIRSCLCSSGKANTATPIGWYTLYAKARYMQFDAYSYADYPCYFAGSAIHSWVKLGSASAGYTGQWYNDGTLGHPASHGCVRLNDENIQFIYFNVPMYTRIIMY